jgi:hypothetical protein
LSNHAEFDVAEVEEVAGKRPADLAVVETDAGVP